MNPRKAHSALAERKAIESIISELLLTFELWAYSDSKGNFPPTKRDDSFLPFFRKGKKNPEHPVNPV